MKQSDYLSKRSIDDNGNPKPMVSPEEKMARKDTIDSILRKAKEEREANIIEKPIKEKKETPKKKKINKLIIQTTIINK
tara:strand:- start:343 stop:579 length:237 start_codon:yes stop_codon:yes gene_type:complete